MYKFNKDGSITRLADNANIPVDEGNADYQDIKTYQAGGGVVEAYAGPTLEETNAQLVLEINQQRDADLVAGVEHGGKLYHTDDRFLTELLGMILGYQAGVYTGTQDIRTRGNEIIAMNAAQIVALASAVGARRRAVYAASWAAKDAL